jgi:hypothetical protein
VPDWTLQIENVVDDGDRTAVVQWRATGTFDGSEPFIGIEPTGRRLDLRGVDVILVDADFKVATNTVYYDGVEFARQIGMLPPRDSAPERAMLAAFNGATKLRQRIRRREGEAAAHLRRRDRTAGSKARLLRPQRPVLPRP